MIKGTIQQKNITVVNINAPNMKASKYIKQLITNIKKVIDNNTTIVENFNIPLTSMDRTSKQKINQETMPLNYTLDQMYLTNIFRTFHLKIPEYTFFPRSYRIFSSIGHVLGHKMRVSKFKKTEVKHVEIKQHSTEQPMDWRRNRKGN